MHSAYLFIFAISITTERHDLTLHEGVGNAFHLNESIGIYSH